MLQIDGPEERAATYLNGTKIVVLWVLFAAVAVWGALDYLWGAIRQGAGLWQIEILYHFLLRIGVVAFAVRGLHISLQKMRSKSS